MLLTAVPIISLSCEHASHLFLGAYGGVYLDCDMLLLRPLTPLLSRDFFYRWSFKPYCNTAAMHWALGSENAATILRAALDSTAVHRHNCGCSHPVLFAHCILSCMCVCVFVLVYCTGSAGCSHVVLLSRDILNKPQINQGESDKRAGARLILLNATVCSILGIQMKLVSQSLSLSLFLTLTCDVSPQHTMEMLPSAYFDPVWIVVDYMGEGAPAAAERYGLNTYKGE